MSVQRISSFKTFTEVKNQQASIKMHEENKAKREQLLAKIGQTLEEEGVTSFDELDEEKRGALVAKIFNEDRAEDIEAAKVKMGQPKKHEDEEGKALQATSEGNAFIYAAAKAKAEGKDEFEHDGKRYKVTIKSDTGLKESSLSESKESQEAEDILDDILGERDMEEIHGMSMEDALDTVEAYGHSGSKAKKIAKELWSLCNESNVNEARSINKIQGDWSKVTAEMAAKAQEWKATEGDAKAKILDELKALTAKKKALEAELDAAVAGKDKDLELAVSESLEVNESKIDAYENEAYKLSLKLKEVVDKFRFAAQDKIKDVEDKKKADQIVKALDRLHPILPELDGALINLKAVLKSAGVTLESLEVNEDIDIFDKTADLMNKLQVQIGNLLHAAKGNKDWTKELEAIKAAFEKLEDRMSIASKKLGMIPESTEVNETEEVNEADINSDEEFKEYAFTVLKKAFGEDFDEAKAQEVVDGILSKSDGDYGSAVGMLTSSLGESVTNEATVEVDAVDPKDKGLAKLLKKHKVTLEVINKEGPSGFPEVRLTGSAKDLKAVLADGEYGWDDEDLADYIEESNTEN
jgi:hypothetical protein